jgi:hypothetical protein
MSNPPTNYICTNGSGNLQDLSTIFQSLNGGTPIADTDFKISTGQDLSNIFLGATSGGPYIDFSTNFIAKNGLDLNSVFEAITPFTISGGTTATSYSSGYYTITITAGTPTITFIPNLSITYYLIGA